MDFDLLHNDEPLTIHADVKKDRLLLIDGDARIEYLYFSLDGATHLVTADGKNRRLIAVRNGETVYVSTPGGEFTFKLPATADGDTFADAGGPGGDKSKLVPPMPGKVVKVLVTAGQKVRPKEKLVIVEAMKMENPLVAPYDAMVVKVNCEEGQLVDTENVLVELKEIE
ncbi:biotin/lipoyl-containing protein [Candidatus Zixiibacteriota bacterium]